MIYVVRSQNSGYSLVGKRVSCPEKVMKGAFWDVGNVLFLDIVLATWINLETKNDLTVYLMIYIYILLFDLKYLLKRI